MLFNAKRFLSVLLILVFLLGGVFNLPKATAATEVVPTVLLHGYKGGEGTFKTMINHYQNSKIAILNNKCVVETNGKFTCTNYKKQTNH